MDTSRWNLPAAPTGGKQKKLWDCLGGQTFANWAQIRDLPSGDINMISYKINYDSIRNAIATKATFEKVLAFHILGDLKAVDIQKLVPKAQRIQDMLTHIQTPLAFSKDIQPLSVLDKSHLANWKFNTTDKHVVGDKDATFECGGKRYALFQAPGFLYSKKVDTEFLARQDVNCFEAFTQAPITPVEDAYLNYMRAHVTPDGKHRGGRDATYRALTQGISASLTKKFCQDMQYVCPTCSEGSSKSSEDNKKRIQKRSREADPEDAVQPHQPKRQAIAQELQAPQPQQNQQQPQPQVLLQPQQQLQQTCHFCFIQAPLPFTNYCHICGVVNGLIAPNNVPAHPGQYQQHPGRLLNRHFQVPRGMHPHLVQGNGFPLLDPSLALNVPNPGEHYGIDPRLLTQSPGSNVTSGSGSMSIEEYVASLDSPSYPEQQINEEELGASNAFLDHFGNDFGNNNSGEIYSFAEHLHAAEFQDSSPATVSDGTLVAPEEAQESSIEEDFAAWFAAEDAVYM